MRSHCFQIVTVEQPVELLAIERQDVAIKVIRPLENFTLQSFLPHAKTSTFPIENLDLVTSLVDEHEQLSGKWIMGELFFDQHRQPVDAI